MHVTYGQTVVATLLAVLSVGCTGGAAPDSVAAETVDSSDTVDADSDTLPSTVTVTYAVWTPASNCWASETAELTYEYWWEYGPESGVSCEDIMWYFAGGDRCFLLGRFCPDSDAASDPAFASTPEQDAACVAVIEQTEAGAIAGCE